MRSREATAAASSCPSLRKSASIDSLYALSDSSGLVEALDHAGKPLCLLSENEIVAQDLFHKRFAALAMTTGGLFLAVERPGPIFDVTAQGPVEAGRTAEESAEKFLCRALGHCGQLRKEKKAPYGLALFWAIFSQAMLKVICPPDFALINSYEVNSLAQRGLVGPLLLSLMPFLDQRHK